MGDAARELTPAEFGMWVGAIVSGIGAIVALCIKAWPTVREWWAERRVDVTAADNKAQAGYDVVITDLRLRLDRAEATIAAMVARELEAATRAAAAIAERDAAIRDVARLEAHVNRLEARLQALET